MAEGGFDEIGLDDFNAPEEQYDEDEETSFIDGPPGFEWEELQSDYADIGSDTYFSRGDLLDWRDRLINSFYEAIAENCDLQPTDIDYNRFELDEEYKTLYVILDDKRKVRITKAGDSFGFRNLDAIARESGESGNFIRDVLGLSDDDYYSGRRAPSWACGADLHDRLDEKTSHPKISATGS